MTDDDLDLLARYVDGEATGAETSDVERRLKSEPAFALAFQAMRRSGELMRIPVDRAVAEVSFEALWTRIERNLPANLPKPSPRAALWAKLSLVFTPPVLLAVGAAAAVAVYLAARSPSEVGAPPKPGPSIVAATPIPAPVRDFEDLDPGAEPFVVEEVRSEGNKTIFVSQPVEEGGATVIWVLDGPETSGKPSTGLAPDEDPI